MKKRTLYIILSISSLIIIVLIFYGLLLKNQKSSNKINEENTNKIKKQQIEDIVEKNRFLNIIFNISKISTSIPSTLPVYKPQKVSITEEYANQIAKSFGFISEAHISKEAVPPLIAYYQMESSLLIYPTLGYIKYTTGIYDQKDFATTPDKEKIISVVFNFLLNKGIIKDRNELHVDKVEILKTDISGHVIQESVDKKYNTAIVNLTKKVDNKYPLLTSVDTGIYEFLINGNYEIESVNIYPNPELEIFSTFKTRTIDDIKSDLKSIKIVKIEGYDEPLKLIDLSIKEIVINDIEIVYKNTLGDEYHIYPAYYLKGAASIEGDINKRAVILETPAIPNEYFLE